MRLMTDKALEGFRTRIGLPQFSDAVRRLQSEADDLKRFRESVPTVRAGYYHDYFCPEHAKQLVFDDGRSDGHLCPEDGRAFEGARLDAAWLWFVNRRLYSSALRSALLGVATGDHQQVEAARGVLLRYADRYPDYEPDPGFESSGRACFHVLDEAVFLVHLAWTFDLVWGGSADPEADKVRRQLLEPAADWIAAHRRGRIHNIECWLNAAIVASGAVCDRRDLVQAGLEGPFGFRDQLTRGGA